MAGTTNAPTEYAARFVLPDLLERGQANALRCPVYRAGALVEPAAGGTVSVYDASGTARVDAATIDVTGRVATYSYTPGATLTVGEGWRVEWALTIAGSPFTARNDAALVRARLHNPVTDQDLYQVVSGLDPNGTAPIHSLPDLQEYLDAAWQKIQRRLIARGNRPNLAMSPSSFFDVALELTLALAFEDFATRLNAAHSATAKIHRDLYEAAWRDLRFLYDVDDSGQADNATKRRSATPTFWLSGRG